MGKKKELCLTAITMSISDSTLYIFIVYLKRKRCKLIQYLLRTRFSLLIWWFSCLLCVTRCLFPFLRVKFISPTPSPCLVKSGLLSPGLREMFRELLLFWFSIAFEFYCSHFDYKAILFPCSMLTHTWDSKPLQQSLCANCRLLHWGSGEVMVSS